MHSITEAIDFAVNKAKFIIKNKSCPNLIEQVIDYVKDGIPYAGMHTKPQEIEENLEKLIKQGYVEVADSCREYLEQHPLVIGGGQVGSHINDEKANLNHGTIFLLDLVTSALIMELEVIGSVSSE